MKSLVVLSMMAMLAFVPLAAAEIAPPSNPCNGVTDTSCTCGYNMTFCEYGQKCDRTVLGYCIDG